MAGNNVTIDAKLNEKGVVSGAKQIKVSLEEIKKADGSLNWSGVKEGESAAKKSGDGFTVLKGIRGHRSGSRGRQELLLRGCADRPDLRDVHEQGERPLGRHGRRTGRA